MKKNRQGDLRLSRETLAALQPALSIWPWRIATVAGGTAGPTQTLVPTDSTISWDPIKGCGPQTADCLSD